MRTVRHLMRMVMLAAFLLPGLSGQAAPAVIAEVQVSGNHLFRTEAIAAAGGVKPGDAFSRESLDAGASRLFDTGLFRSVNYRYAPAPGDRPGTTVTWEVQEAEPEVGVRIDVPGLDDATVWADAVTANPLLTRPLPGSELAAAFCQRALTAAAVKHGIREALVLDTGSDIATGRLTWFLRLASAPEIDRFEFSGNRVLTAGQLAQAMLPAAGGKFSEYRIREALEQYVRPLYEDRGYLRVAFGRLTPPATAGVARIAVEEGRSWTLRSVRFTGEGAEASVLARAGSFPEGKPAQWTEIRNALDGAREVLVSQGYLHAKLTPERTFDEAAGAVDLTVRVDRGPLFRFGRLVLAGVPPDLAGRVRKAWKLSPGAPMDGTYIQEFLRDAFQVLGERVNGVSQSMAPANEPDVVDVHITFRSN